MFDVFETLKTLAQCALPSGFERRQGEVLLEMAKPYVDEAYFDTLGNLICRKKGKGKKIMYPAHMDVIGFMATYIDERGFVWFEGIGGHGAMSLTHRAIVFENGVRGNIAQSSTVDTGKPAGAAQIKDMYIDIGASSREEAEGLISVGMVARFDAPTVRVAGDCIMSPYCDDLISCVTLLLCMEQLGKTDNDVYFVFTTQEEVGLRGAATSGHAIYPDICIAVDVTGNNDTPDKRFPSCKLGGGPVCEVKNGSVLAYRQVVRRIYDTAERLGMDIQTNSMLFGGTDAGAVQNAQGGVLSGGVSIPTRNIHSPGEIIHEGDVKEAARLLAAIAMDTI